MPDPITTLRLDVLLPRLREREAQILAQIDEDSLLKRRHVGALTIANAGPKLFEPIHEHQLFAKGIVYARSEQGLQLVSLPLVKMYNHQRRVVSDDTTSQVLSLPGTRVRFQEKLDGTMVQLFAYDGRAHLSTRSVLEDPSQDVPHMEFVTRARHLLEQQAPQLLDPALLKGRTLVFEMIHPTTRQITRYGAREEMVLLSVFDLAEACYWSTPRVERWAADHGASFAGDMGSYQSLSAGVASIHEQLREDPMLPEGTIVSFERDDVMLHRVKVKTPSYLEAFAQKMSVNYRTTAQLLWARPDLHDWEALIAHLTHERLSEEEVEAFYREHFDAFMQWFEQLKARRERVHALYDACAQALGAPDARLKEFMKDLALRARTHHPEDFHLIMARARKGPLSLHRMMCYDPPVSGFQTDADPYPHTVTDHDA